MKLVLISDTHEKHDQILVPDGDVLIHAGDFTMMGEIPHVQKFNEWLGKLPHKHKIVIAGNHEVGWDGVNTLEKFLSNAEYLEDSSINIDGVNFHGMPWTPTFGSGWAFNANRDKMKRTVSGIAEPVDVLISHGPPAGILDKTLLDGEHVGSNELREEISSRLNPKICVFGHIHESYGQLTVNETRFFNASVVDFSYKVANKPWVVEI